jgi:fluoride ion exporter CrcB/FEX
VRRCEALLSLGMCGAVSAFSSWTTSAEADQAISEEQVGVLLRQMAELWVTAGRGGQGSSFVQAEPIYL